MTLKSINLTNFRNIDKKKFDFNEILTIIVGHNSIGKTNLLESIYAISKGSGFRESNGDELISLSENQSIINADFKSDAEQKMIRVVIDNSNGLLQKAYFINKLKKRLFEYVKLVPKVVIFSPALLYVIDGNPSDRRSFFDKIISTTDIEYKKRLTNYDTALRKRNKLLEKEKNITKLREELPFWDTYLVEQAKYIAEKRKKCVDFLNQHNKLDSKLFGIRYIQNEISLKRLEDTFEKQLLVKRTLIGPQRDEYEIDIDRGEGFKNVHHFGSRSEQRLALFWLLINEIKLIENYLHEKPIVLLDDIFSELDIDNKSLILKLITEYQTVVTTTEEEIEHLVHIPHSIIRL